MEDDTVILKFLERLEDKFDVMNTKLWDVIDIMKCDKNDTDLKTSTRLTIIESELKLAKWIGKIGGTVALTSLIANILQLVL